MGIPVVLDDCQVEMGISKRTWSALVAVRDVEHAVDHLEAGAGGGLESGGGKAIHISQSATSAFVEWRERVGGEQLGGARTCKRKSMPDVLNPLVRLRIRQTDACVNPSPK